MTVQRLKEHGTYIGFDEKFGYVYKVANSFYTFNRNGVQKISK